MDAEREKVLKELQGIIKSLDELKIEAKRIIDKWENVLKNEQLPDRQRAEIEENIEYLRDFYGIPRE